MRKFEDVLRERLADHDARRSRKILAILDGDDTPRRRRMVRRMEATVRASLGIKPGKVDWDAIDWPTVIEMILKILMLLLPLLFAEMGE